MGSLRMRSGTVRVSAVFGGAILLSSLLAANAFASTPKSVTNGAVKVINYGDGNGVGSVIVFTGAIGDGGFADSIDANGTPDPQANTEVHFALSQGTFNINVQP